MSLDTVFSQPLITTLKVIKNSNETAQQIYYTADRVIQGAAERTPLFEKRINSKPQKIRQMISISGKHIECRLTSMCLNKSSLKLRP